MANLILTCGLPGSGKSTLSQKLEKDYCVVLCPDDFRFILTGKNFHTPAEEMVWSHVKVAARALLMHNQRVVIDATATTPARRKEWVSLVKSLDKESHIDCMVMLTPFSECVKRNEKRERYVPIEVMEKQRDAFVLPSITEGFDMVEYCNSEGEIIGSVSFDEDNDVWFNKRGHEFHFLLENPYFLKDFR